MTTDTPRSGGIAITALCLGIAGIVIGLIPILGIFAFALGAVGIVLALVALSRTRWRGVLSWFALAASVLAIVMAIIGIVIVSDAFSDLEDELDDIEQEFEDSSSRPEGEAAFAPSRYKPSEGQFKAGSIGSSALG